MILLARIEDARTTADGQVLVTSAYWVDTRPCVCGSVVVTRPIEPADAVRASVAAACVAAAAADFGVDPADITSATVL